MLRFLTTGFRRFGVQPMSPHRRMNWEFYAVVRGRLATLLPGVDNLPLKKQHLWLFPPETSHGWRGDGDHKAYIVAFHFGFVPPPLDEVARKNGYLSVDLTDAEAQRLLEMVEELDEHYRELSSVSAIHFQKALIELSLIALKNTPEQKLGQQGDSPSVKVETALIWFSDNINHKPKLDEVARAVHVSPSHLRRLFQHVRKQSPQAAFTRLKIERAMEYLSESEEKLEVVAAACGFSGGVNFCRVFKAQTGFSPDVWRKTRLAPLNSAATRDADQRKRARAGA